MNKTDTNSSFVDLVVNKRQRNGHSNIQHKMLRGISQGAKEVLSKNPRPGFRDSKESDSQAKPDRKIGVSQVWKWVQRGRRENHCRRRKDLVQKTWRR